MEEPAALDDAVIKALNEVRRALHRDIVSAENALAALREHADDISAVIVSRCEHTYRREYPFKDPCGSAPKVCSKCGHYLV